MKTKIIPALALSLGLMVAALAVSPVCGAAAATYSATKAV